VAHRRGSRGWLSGVSADQDRSQLTPATARIAHDLPRPAPIGQVLAARFRFDKQVGPARKENRIVHGAVSGLVAVLVAGLLNVLHVPSQSAEDRADQCRLGVLLTEGLAGQALQAGGNILQPREKALPKRAFA
jgi:hypothetical protein